MSRILKLSLFIVIVTFFSVHLFANQQLDKAFKAEKITNKKIDKSNQTAFIEYNKGVDNQREDKFKEAIKNYVKAINLSAVKPEIRSRAYQNLGVIAHKAARKELIKNPEKTIELITGNKFK